MPPSRHCFAYLLGTAIVIICQWFQHFQHMFDVRYARFKYVENNEIFFEHLVFCGFNPRAPTRISSSYAGTVEFSSVGWLKPPNANERQIVFQMSRDEMTWGLLTSNRLRTGMECLLVWLCHISFWSHGGSVWCQSFFRLGGVKDYPMTRQWVIATFSLVRFGPHSEA